MVVAPTFRRPGFCLFLALPLTRWMTQDKWLQHICQVSQSKCETCTLPFRPKLSLHSTCIPHICSIVIVSLLPHDPLCKLQLTSPLLTCQPAVFGVQGPKAGGRVQCYKTHLPEAPTSAISPCLKSWCAYRGFLHGTQLMDYTMCTLSVHLHVSHSDMGSQVHFHLWASIFPSTTSTDMKNHSAQG